MTVSWCIYVLGVMGTSFCLLRRLELTSGNHLFSAISSCSSSCKHASVAPSALSMWTSFKMFSLPFCRWHLLWFKTVMNSSFPSSIIWSRVIMACISGMEWTFVAKAGEIWPPKWFWKNRAGWRKRWDWLGVSDIIRVLDALRDLGTAVSRTCLIQPTTLYSLRPSCIAKDCMARGTRIQAVSWSWALLHSSVVFRLKLCRATKQRNILSIMEWKVTWRYWLEGSIY